MVYISFVCFRTNTAIKLSGYFFLTSRGIGVDKTTSQQVILAAGDSITLDIANRLTVYVDADTNGEWVDYLCVW